MQVQVHEDLNHWVNARRNAGHPDHQALTHARYLDAIARRIGVEPCDLPADAVALHFSGGGRFTGQPDREASPSTTRAYQRALDLWLAYLADGSLSLATADVRAAPELADPLLTGWGRNLRVDSLSENTIGTYTRNVERVARWSGVEVDGLTVEHVRDYLGTRDLAVRSRNSYLQAIQRFYLDHGLPDPTEGIKRGKTPRSTPRPIPEDELAGLLTRAAYEITNAPNKMAERRARIMKTSTILGAYAGLRRFEIVKVAHRDARRDKFGNSFLTIVGKGQTGKTREGLTIQIPPQVHAEILAWPRIGPIFGTGFSSDALGLQWSAWAASEGVHASMHQLRHRYGTELYRATRDILFVRDQMRHSSTIMTERYVALVPSQDRRDVIQGFASELDETGDRLRLVV